MSIYTAPSQIAQRQLALFKDKNVLLAGEVEDQFALELADICQSVSLFTTHYGQHQSWQQQDKVTSYFSAEFTEALEIDLVLFYWPKAKAEAQYLLAMLMAKFGVGTEICVVGENRSGVRSIEKLFLPYGEIKKYDSARRCSFYWGECSLSPSSFHIEDWYQTYSVKVGEDTLTVKSLPGVFSHGELDQGSRLLLEHLPKLTGKVLDFGCGAGVIGAWLALRYPDIDLDMCDISALAIASTQATLAANGLRANVFASDVYSNINQQYDYLISNPPFHSGLHTHYASTETLLAQAPNYLTHDGALWIVANHFLKYAPIITQALGYCDKKAQNTQFTIYAASRSA